MKEKWPLGNRAHRGVTFQLSDKQMGIKPNIWPACRRRLARRKSEQDDALAAIFSRPDGHVQMGRRRRKQTPAAGICWGFGEDTGSSWVQEEDAEAWEGSVSIY